MARNTILLQIVARLNPAIWDAIHPMGPVRIDRILGRQRPGSHFDSARASSSPQDVALQILQETVLQAAQLVQLLVFGHQLHGDGVERFQREVDDWCGTKPQPFPWPRNWPLPQGGSSDPDPHPWLAAEVLVVAALTLADLGGRLGPEADGALREAVDRAADQLSEAAVSVELDGRSAGVAKSVG